MRERVSGRAAGMPARGPNGRWLPRGAVTIIEGGAAGEVSDIGEAGDADEPGDAGEAGDVGNIGGAGDAGDLGEAGTLAKAGGNATAATGVKVAKRPASIRRAKARKKGGGRKRPVRWSARREEMFLSTLAETAKVREAIRVSQLSETNVYRRRRQSPEFAAKWLTALRQGYAELETMMLDRALNGVEKPVWHGGKQVGVMLEYNDRMALSLLQLHRGTVMGEARFAAETPVEELRAELKAKLGEMNKRMGGAG